MSLKYLFGPVPAAFAEQNLQSARAQKHCLTFGPDGDTDLTVRVNDTWEDVCKRFPADWTPDFLVLYLPYSTIAPCLWSAPLPRVGLALDWHLLWHGYRKCLPDCDLVLTDSRGADVLAQEGIHQAQAANLNGCERAFLEETWSDSERDIDILFVGNLNSAVQRERMPWLKQVAALSQRWRVRIQTATFGESYRRLLARARIVFQFSGRGKSGRRSFEAAAAGALIFQEADNRELPALFRDRKECIYYRHDDLENLLDYYLEHERERRSIAEAARAKARQWGFEQLWDTEIQSIEAEWPALRYRAGRSGLMEAVESLWARCWQAQASSRHEDLTLIRDLEKGLLEQSQPAPFHNAIGCLLSRQAQRDDSAAQATQHIAIACFRQALKAQPNFVLAGLNLAECLGVTGQKTLALETARRTLATLHATAALDPVSVEGLPLLTGFDLFRVAWERAAWEHAANPAAESQAKRQLLLWRLNCLVGNWTGESAPYYEAALCRPDLPAPRLALADSLLRAGQPGQARTHAQFALAANPFDRDAARICYQVCNALGDKEGQQQLLAERQWLASAAPQLVPAEPWFTPARPKGNELASILILCCNQLAYTRLCLESLLRHTRPPYHYYVNWRDRAYNEV